MARTKGGPKSHLRHKSFEDDPGLLWHPSRLFAAPMKHAQEPLACLIATAARKRDCAGCGSCASMPPRAERHHHSRLINGLRNTSITLNRRFWLTAVRDPQAFAAVVARALAS